MALWLVRGGRHGEYEERFFTDNRVYLTWDELPGPELAQAHSSEQVRAALARAYPGESVNTVGNWAGQIGAFLVRMKQGDWVVTPRKNRPVVAIGEICGSLQFDPHGADRFQFFWPVRWLNTDIPRSVFDQDILYSMGAFLTICEIKRNDAEKRVKAVARGNWQAAPAPVTPALPVATDNGQDTRIDLEQFARDEIAKRIAAKFKGHGMARLVEGILKAQGFTTYRSPEGPDRGVDILAAAGPLGFGDYRICVQVKSGDTPVDHPTLSQLRGAMQAVGATQGLMVSWSGFRSSVDRDQPNHFFQVRLWNQADLIEQLQMVYDKLDPDLQAELPLKRIWVLAPEE